MANINIQIPDELHKKIKLQAVKEDITIKEYIIRVMEDNMSKRTK